jgi:hypothetical protein
MKRIPLLLLGLCVGPGLIGQGPAIASRAFYTVSGRVLHSAGDPPFVAGAEILATWEGGSKDVAAEGDGTYSIEVPDQTDVTLVFYYTGFTRDTRAIKLNGGPQTCDACLVRAKSLSYTYWRKVGTAIALWPENDLKRFWRESQEQIPVTGKVGLAASLMQHRPEVSKLIPELAKYAEDDATQMEELWNFYTVKLDHGDAVPKQSELAMMKFKIPSVNTLSELTGEWAAANPDDNKVRKIMESCRVTWGADAYATAVTTERQRKDTEKRTGEFLVLLREPKTLPAPKPDRSE